MKHLRNLQTFNTSFGRYRFLRLPYGLCSASEIFQQKMKQIFDELEGVEVYIYDLIIWGNDKAEHDLRLRQSLDKMRQENKSLTKINVNFVSKKFCTLGLSLLRLV